MKEALPGLSAEITTTIAPLADNELRRLIAKILHFEDSFTNAALMRCDFAALERTRAAWSQEEQNAASILCLQLDLPTLDASMRSIEKTISQIRQNQRLKELLCGLREWHRDLIYQSIKTMIDNEQLLTSADDLIEIVTHRYALDLRGQEKLRDFVVPFLILEIERLFNEDGLLKLQQNIDAWES